MSLGCKAQSLLNSTRAVDFLGPLALRLYLVPIFWMAGTKKLGSMEDTIAWFGNPDWGLGLPFPTIMAWAASLTEAGGAIALLIGLGVRWISVPLMATMIVAAVTVHYVQQQCAFVAVLIKCRELRLAFIQQHRTGA